MLSQVLCCVVDSDIQWRAAARGVSPELPCEHVSRGTSAALPPSLTCRFVSCTHVLASFLHARAHACKIPRSSADLLQNTTMDLQVIVVDVECWKANYYIYILCINCCPGLFIFPVTPVTVVDMNFRNLNIGMVF